MSTTSMPASARMASTRPGNLLSRSRIRNRARLLAPSRSMTTFLAAWAMARSWYRAAAQSRSRLPCVTARIAITPRRVMPIAWRPHTLTARINQQIYPAWIPRRDDAVRYDGEGPRLTADFEVVIPRLPVAPDRVEDLGLELAKVRRLDPDPGPALKTHENEKKDINCAQPSIGGCSFVANVGWRAGLLGAAGSLGDAPTGAVHGEPVGGAAASSHGGQSPAQDRSRLQTIASTTLPRRLMHTAAGRPLLVPALADGDIRPNAGIAAGPS